VQRPCRPELIAELARPGRTQETAQAVLKNHPGRSCGKCRLSFRRINTTEFRVRHEKKKFICIPAVSANSKEN